MLIVTAKCSTLDWLAMGTDRIKYVQFKMIDEGTGIRFFPTRFPDQLFRTIECGKRIWTVDQIRVIDSEISSWKGSKFEFIIYSLASDSATVPRICEYGTGRSTEHMVIVRLSAIYIREVKKLVRLYEKYNLQESTI